MLTGVGNSVLQESALWMPKIEVYLGEPARGYQFIEMYKMPIVGLNDEKKIKRFKVFCGIDVF